MVGGIVAIAECEMVRLGAAKRIGKSTIEWCTDDGSSQVYCYGYTNKMNDELLQVCKSCSGHVSKAQDDLDRYLETRGEKNA